MKRICHLSSVHQGLDVRIFHKECVSLAKAGFDVHLVISSNANEVAKAKKCGVYLHPLPSYKSRLFRILVHTWKVFKIAKGTNAKIFHFHDPELIPYGLFLVFLGKKVIYDAHEDVAEDFLSKQWAASWSRKLLSKIIEKIEKIASKKFFVIAATPCIQKKFLKKNGKTATISNYPSLNELKQGNSWANKKAEVCYVGGIAKIRGVYELCRAMENVKTCVRLNLVGEFNDPADKQAACAMVGWKRVNYLGFLDRECVQMIFDSSVAGLVILHPISNYLVSLPIKMFEYMGAGIPVIASDFPLWRKIISQADCGILVNPLDAVSIARAIDYFIVNPGEAKRMGKNGRKAIDKLYNWEGQEKKLISIYNSFK